MPSTANKTRNRLYYGDNLAVMRGFDANGQPNIPSNSVDLIYLDPPFNSRQDYNVLFAEKDGTRSASQVTAFKDTWEWNQEASRSYEEVVERGGRVAEVMQSFRTLLGASDMLAYLTMMAERLVELRRVLKDTGSIYFHCDPTASHYLKLLMDGVFGPKNFRSEIIWRRSNSHNKLTRQLGPIHDTIFFYSKTSEAKFHPGTRPYTKKYIEDRFKNNDKRGRFQTNYLTGPGRRNGESGKPWRGFDPTAAGRHWAIPASVREYLPNRGRGMSAREQLDILYEAGLIVFPKKSGGQPMYKQYIGPGTLYQDIWAYQPNTNGVLWQTEECIDQDVKWLEDEDEKLGYDTQKPRGLLERILITSTDEGDTVLDPFCGCGTTIDAAQHSNRRWIGIDITHLAIGLIRTRLDDSFGTDVRSTYEVIGEPTDIMGAAQLAAENKWQFQYWALGLCGARPAEGIRKGADRGVDGRLYFHDDNSGKSRQIIFSVKGGQSVHVSEVRDLIGVLEREKAAIGVFLSIAEPTKSMQKEAAEAGFYISMDGSRYPRVQLLTIEGLMKGTERLERPLHIRDVTFKPAPRHRAAPATSLPLNLVDEE